MMSIKHFRAVILLSSCAVAGSLSVPANAQASSATTPDQDDEVSPLTPTPPAPPSAPIVVNWEFKDGAGNMNLTLNRDGRYVFSGAYTGHKRNKDFDISLALKDSTGAIILFRFNGDASNGTQWSKVRKSSFLSDDFALFAGHLRWHAAYHFSESVAGQRAEYEARERKREEAWKNYEDAKNRNDTKVESENKAVLDQLKHEEASQIAQAQPRGAQQQPSGGGGGGGIGGIASSAASAVAGLVSGGGASSAIGALGGGLGSIF
jgi:hypothetical protein